MRRLFDQTFQAFEGKREVRTALRPGHRMDLVDDDGIHGAKDLARFGRKQEVEGFRRGDEHVRGIAANVLAFALGSVTGARGDGDVRGRQALTRGGDAKACEGRTEVAFDIV